MNAAQRLWERLGLPTALAKHKNGGYIGTAAPKKFRNSPPRRKVRLGDEFEQNTPRGAFALAVAKYDGEVRTKPAGGVKESRRELERRLNWLRNRIAETA